MAYFIPISHLCPRNSYPIAFSFVFQLPSMKKPGDISFSNYSSMKYLKSVSRSLQRLSFKNFRNNLWQRAVKLTFFLEKLLDAGFQYIIEHLNLFIIFQLFGQGNGFNRIHHYSIVDENMLFICPRSFIWSMFRIKYAKMKCHQINILDIKECTLYTNEWM